VVSGKKKSARRNIWLLELTVNVDLMSHFSDGGLLQIMNDILPRIFINETSFKVNRRNDCSIVLF
jgi:hypothetical protein